MSETLEISEQCRANSDGFTILEMLVALAIFSLTSLALFQSLNTFLNISKRAVRGAESAITRSVDRQILYNLVDGIVQPWNETEIAFKGQPQGFSGLSTQAFSEEPVSLTPFTISLTGAPYEQKTLSYLSGDRSWVLVSKLDKSASFEYLTSSRDWVATWPPIRNKKQVGNNEELPVAVRLKNYDNLTFMTLPINRHRRLPFKLD